ncbi:MAG: hypothetical protein K6L75_14020 [Cellvibrionaceae bacterium]
MPTLSEYSNVYNSALILLTKKGYQSWYDSEAELFCAEKDGWDFMAESPCGLLGLVSMFEFIKPSKYEEYWWKLEGEDIYKNLPQKPNEYVSVIYSSEKSK